MPNHRSLTIVELLIVIALLGAMASIVVPLIADSLDERAFDAAGDVTSEQLVLARAHAQATGEPVEVRYHASSAQVEARVFAPAISGGNGLAGISVPESHGSVLDPERSLSGESTRLEVDDSGRAIAEPWANRALSHGIRIMNRQPEPKVGVMPTNAASADADSILAELGLPSPSEHDVRLAVFMPDGSALMGSPVWFRDEDGRIGRLTINPWTGLPMFERIPATAGENSASGRQPDEQRESSRAEDPQSTTAGSSGGASRPTRQK